MRKKLIFEDVANELVFQPQFLVKLLVGGVLSFVPGVNILAFGYLYRFSVQLRRTGRVVLPDWKDWSGLFSDGLKFGAIWVVYWLLPLLVALLVAKGLFSIGFFVLGYLLVSATFFVASTLFCSALYRFHMNPEYSTLLEVGRIARMSLAGLYAYILPILAFAGVFILLLPLYGFVFFAGFLLLITQLNSCYRSFESNR